MENQLETTKTNLALNSCSAVTIKVSALHGASWAAFQNKYGVAEADWGMSLFSFWRGIVWVLIACSNRKPEQPCRASLSAISSSFLLLICKFSEHFWLVLSKNSVLSQKHEELLQDSERCRRGLQAISITRRRLVFLIFQACLIWKTGVVPWDSFHCNTRWLHLDLFLGGDPAKAPSWGVLHFCSHWGSNFISKLQPLANYTISITITTSLPS